MPVFPSPSAARRRSRGTADTAGFTLLELLVAVGFSLVVVTGAMTVYRNAANGQQRFMEFRRVLQRDGDLRDFVDQVLLHGYGPAHGDAERLAVITDLNLLGYGREIVMLRRVVRQRSEFLSILMCPAVVVEGESDGAKISIFFNDPDRYREYRHEEVFPAFVPAFRYWTVEGEKEVLAGDYPTRIEATLVSKDGELHATRYWQ